MSPDEIERLIFEVLDGSCEAGERERLMALLLENPAAFEIYCRCCEMDSALHRIAKGRAGLASTASIGGPHSGHRRRARTSLLVAVAAVLMFGLLLLLFRAPPIEVLAKITTSPDALYHMRHTGEASPDGTLAAGSIVELSQGCVEIEFRNGVRSVIEAPAEWVVVGEERLTLRLGVAWFDVPAAAVGFQVLTPELEITDLGTQFGVLVEHGRNNQVHVFSGVIEARHRLAAQTIPPLRLTAGQAVTASPSRKLEWVPVEAERFPTSLPATLPHMTWSFGEAEPAGWPAAGPHPAIADAFARPIGAPAILSDGPGGAALRLIPGEYLKTEWQGVLGSRARSIAGWIRIPEDVSDAEMPTSIVFWGREGDVLSRRKWRIGLNPELYDEGGVKGALRTEFGSGYVIGDTDLRDGRWHHVASVFQGGNTSDNTGRILHFINGKPEASSAVSHQFIDTESNIPLRFGGDRGRIDLADFIVMEGALTPEQVAALARRESLPSR